MVGTIILTFKRNKLKRKLNDRDLNNFNDITAYIGFSSLSLVEQEVVFQQILDMMLQAKSEGKLASEVIGDDVKGFCDSIIKESNYNKSIFEGCFNYIEIFLQTGFIFLLMMFIFNLIRNGWDSSLKNQAVFYKHIVLSLSISVVLFLQNFIIKRKQIFKTKKDKTGYSWVFGFIGIFLSLLITDMIRTKFPQLATAHIIPYENKMLVLIIFLIAFGRDICYLIKSINRKFREQK